jgi:hypothetical protein
MKQTTALLAALLAFALGGPATAQASSCRNVGGAFHIKQTGTTCKAARYVAKFTVQFGYVYQTPQSFAVTLRNTIVRCSSHYSGSNYEGNAGPYHIVKCKGRVGKRVGRINFRVWP